MMNRVVGAFLLFVVISSPCFSWKFDSVDRTIIGILLDDESMYFPGAKREYLVQHQGSLIEMINESRNSYAGMIRFNGLLSLQDQCERGFLSKDRFMNIGVLLVKKWEDNSL